VALFGELAVLKAAAAASKAAEEQTGQKLAAAIETIASLSARLGGVSFDPSQSPGSDGKGLAKLTFPRISVMSPSNSLGSFLSDPFVGLLATPVTVDAHASLNATFRGLLKAATSVRGFGAEANFYALATSHLPSFAERVGSP
jgi:hypothetical protein